MSGRDLHLPRLRHVAARGRSSSSSSSSSSKGRRGRTPPVPLSAHTRPGNRWIRSSSEESTPSTHKSHSSTHNPSDHDWDSPGWQRRRLPRSRLAYSSSSPSPSVLENSQFSCWSSPTSSQKRAAAAAAAAHHRKNMERIRGLTELRYDSLIAPPPYNSPEDWERIRHMGLLPASPTLHPAPHPFWCDEGYVGSDSDSSNTPNSSSTASSTRSMSPRFVKSEGGASPTMPGFSVPFFECDSESNTKARKPKGKKRNSKGGRCLFNLDD